MIEVDEHQIYIGDSQAGKTTTALGIQQVQHDYIKIFVNSKDDNKLYNINNSGRGAAKYINVTLEQFRYLLNLQVTDGIIEIRPEISEVSLIDQITPYLNHLLAWKRKSPDIKTHCCIDEIHLYQSKMSLITAIKNLVVMGKGINCWLGMLSQRPTQIHNDLMSQTEYYFIQGLNQRDLKYLWENRYLAIPEGWILPLNDPNCTYPWKLNKHRLFYQTSKFEGMKEFAPLNKPPF